MAKVSKGNPWPKMNFEDSLPADVPLPYLTPSSPTSAEKWPDPGDCGDFWPEQTVLTDDETREEMATLMREQDLPTLQRRPRRSSAVKRKRREQPCEGQGTKRPRAHRPTAPKEWLQPGETVELPQDIWSHIQDKVSQKLEFEARKEQESHEAWEKISRQMRAFKLGLDIPLSWSDGFTRRLGFLDLNAVADPELFHGGCTFERFPVNGGESEAWFVEEPARASDQI